MSKTTMKCDKCEGTGQVPNPRIIGAAMRVLRTRADVSLRDVATKMQVSAAYLSDLELGRRNWSEETQKSFHNALHNLRRK